jgi:putative acetyltransferase
MSRSAQVRPEAPADAAAARAVNDAAFGRTDEARVVDALREAGRLTVSLVAVDGDEVIGHIAFSPATLHDDDGTHAIAGLGPMAVRPDRQRLGIGSALVREGLDACRRLGHDVIVVLGHPDFYSRFGFVTARPLGITCEYTAPDEAFMVAELSRGALRGRRGLVRYAPELKLAED